MTQDFDRVLLRSCPSEWAGRYRMIRDDDTGEVAPLGFRHREWQRDLLDDLAPRVVVMKAAQMGVTELMMSRAIHTVDALGKPVLYVFPTERDVSDFCAARFDPMLKDSPGMADLFTDVSNVGLKRCGNVALYLRGSNSPSGLKSIPVAVLFLDEFDEMTDRPVSLARKRLIGHRETVEWNVSTPTYPGIGIHREFLTSDQRHWEIPCPRCGESQVLDWEKNVALPGRDDVEEPAWRCGAAACRELWTEDERLEAIDLGKWVAHAPENEVHGYHVSQLYSPAATAKRLANDWADAQKSVSHMEDFDQSIRGLPFEGESTKITDGDVAACRGTVRMLDRLELGSSVTTVMGVDVGSLLHYWVLTPGQGDRPRALSVGTVPDFEGLDLVTAEFGPSHVVIDANPERHKATEYRDRWEGRVSLAFYSGADKLKGQETDWNEDHQTVTAHRTAVMDRVAAKIKRRAYAFPADLPVDAGSQLTNVFRTQEVKPSGEVRALWSHSGPDHYFHALLYADVALEQVTGAVSHDWEEDPSWGGGETDGAGGLPFAMGEGDPGVSEPGDFFGGSTSWT